ncbi:MAG: winged helix DNA-binding domain-containing protein [Chitinophagaceae bacterium]
MTSRDIILTRLSNQQITSTSFTKPTEIVSWFGAMQAQEYAMVKWAIGLRLPGCSNDTIEESFNKGEILRTHVLRPTWHFVSPADIRWMLALSAPRVQAFNAYYYRQHELDDQLFKRCHKILVKALQGGKHLTRTALQQELARAKIIADGPRLGSIMMHAELEAIICSGPRTGKQFTYALLEERAPGAPMLKRDEALATLIKKYFASRGPAMLQDFVWWSGLTMKDAKEGVDMLGNQLIHETINGQAYLLVSTAGQQSMNKSTASFLMPDYDEYGIAYKDRSAIIGNYDATSRYENPVYNRMIVLDGRIVGSWRPTITKNAVQVETSFFSPISKTKQQSLQRAIKKYEAFVLGD